jgi:hypothetical protein
MTYYRIDTLALGSIRSSSVAALCASLMDALDGLRAVRMNECRPAAEWVAALGSATERALLLFDTHVDSALGHRPAVHTTSCRTTTALRALNAEHSAIRGALTAQLAMTDDAAMHTPAGAVRLLDIAVDTECLIALHINGLAALVRRNTPGPSASYMSTLERTGPPRTGVEQ